MIKGNEIYFGYGSVAVGPFGNSLRVLHIKPPQPIGKRVISNDVEIIGKPIHIPFKKISEIHELHALLSSVDKYEHKRFVFKGCVFDFSNYNPDSVKTVRENLDRVKRNLIFLLAS